MFELLCTHVFVPLIHAANAVFILPFLFLRSALLLQLDKVLQFFVIVFLKLLLFCKYFGVFSIKHHFVSLGKSLVFLGFNFFLQIIRNGFDFWVHRHKIFVVANHIICSFFLRMHLVFGPFFNQASCFYLLLLLSLVERARFYSFLLSFLSYLIVFDVLFLLKFFVVVLVGFEQLFVLFVYLVELFGRVFQCLHFHSVNILTAFLILHRIEKLVGFIWVLQDVVVGNGPPIYQIFLKLSLTKTLTAFLVQCWSFIYKFSHVLRFILGCEVDMKLLSLVKARQTIVIIRWYALRNSGMLCHSSI